MATHSQTFDVIEPGSSALVTTQPDSLILRPVMDLKLAKERLVEFQSFVKGYLVEGEDYGKIPGISKPSLFKPGAEKLCELYGLADTYPEDGARRVENWETGLFFYEFTCRLTKKGTDIIVGEGKGSCSTYESRYRYRDMARSCPSCTKETIIKGKEEYGGGWLCWAKKGGCGAKFKDGDRSIEGQEIGKVENENMHDLINTVLKMAKKRAKIDAVIAATRSSGIFTQDVEDTKAAADRTDVPIEEEEFSGVLAEITQLRGEWWMRVGESAVVVPKNKPDLLKRLQGAHGEWIRIKAKPLRAPGGKGYYSILEVLEVGKAGEQDIPFEATDDDIPF